MVLLAELTSPDVDALPRDIVVVYPVASCEQHSLHLPVFVDTMINDAVTRGVHEKLPDDVLVLPTQCESRLPAAEPWPILSPRCVGCSRATRRRARCF